MIEQEGMERVTVDVTAPVGGTSTVILDDGAAPSVTTLPGQTARIIMQKPAAPPTDE